jgi:hypothetical protein
MRLAAPAAPRKPWVERGGRLAIDRVKELAPMNLKPILFVLGLMAGLSAPAVAQPPGPPPGHGVAMNRPLGMGRAPVVRRYGHGWERRREYRRCKAVRGERHHRRDRRCRGGRR